jgi:nucleotide-binding universal stress UspA family protein
VARGGGLATSSFNDVLRRRLEQELREATSALGPDTDATRAWSTGTRMSAARASADLDLLVVGSRGYGPLRAVLLGSVSTPVVRSAQSPLVVLPRGADDQSPPQGTTSPRRIA